MIVDLKVHVEIVHYEGRQGSNMRPRESYFLSLRKSGSNMRPRRSNMRPRGSNMRPRESYFLSLRKSCFFCERFHE